MSSFIKIMTGGDITKIATFIISFVFLSAILLGILYALKKIGIHFKIENGKITLENVKVEDHHHPKKHDNLNNEKQEYLSGVQILSKTDSSSKQISLNDLENFLIKNGYTPATNSTMINGLKMIEKDSSQTEKFLNDVSQFSKESWESFKIAKLTNDLEDKERKILSLEKTNTILKKQINLLNKELIDYKCYDDPILVEFRNIKNILKEDYLHFMKKIILDNKLKENLINEKTELRKYCKNSLNLLLILIGNRLMQNLHVDLWRDEKNFAYEILKVNGNEFFSNFVDMIDVIVKINIDSQKDLEKRRGIIDKKILSVFSGITKSHWEFMFSPQTKDSIEKIKKAKNSFEYYKNNCWNFKEIHELFYQIGTDMIIVYEQIKSNSFDKQVSTSLSFFDSLIYFIDSQLKDFVIKKHKSYLDNKDGKNLENYVQSIFPSEPK